MDIHGNKDFNIYSSKNLLRGWWPARARRWKTMVGTLEVSQRKASWLVTVLFGPRADDTNYCQAKYMLLTNVARKYGLTSIFFKIFMIKTFQLTTIIFSTVLFE